MSYKINKKKVVGLIIIIFFLISGIGSVLLINFQESSNTLKTPKTSTLQFDDTISETMYQNIEYNFSTVFYDDANYDNVYTDAYLETTHLTTSVENNNTISGVDNYFNEYAENVNITIAYGELVSNGTLHTKDADSTDIDSTQGGVYNGTYSFTDDASDVGFPDGWTGGQPTKVSVIDVLAGHTKVVQLNDDDAVNAIYIENNFAEQEDCTIEFWWRATNVVKGTHIRGYDNAWLIIKFHITSGSLRIYDGNVVNIVYNAMALDTWYRFKMVVDWSDDQYDLYLYSAAGALLGSFLDADWYMFRSSNDGLDMMRFESDTATVGYILYWDGFDYSWTAGYIEGRNAEAEDAIVDINVTIEGLNPHLSLEALQIELYSYYKTDASVNTEFSIYHFEDSHWDVLDNSIHINFNDIEGDTYLTPTLNEYINESGITLVRYLCESSSIFNYQFSIDQLGVDVYTKLHMWYKRSFDLTGQWKYRWYIVGSDYYSDWDYFDIKESIQNFEGISESEYTTRWSRARRPYYECSSTG